MFHFTTIFGPATAAATRRWRALLCAAALSGFAAAGAAPAQSGDAFAPANAGDAALATCDIYDTVHMDGFERSITPGTASFSSLRYDANELDGHVVITVLRKCGRAGAASVKLDIADGGGHPVPGFEGFQATVQWADGDGSPKNVSIPVPSDDVFQSTRRYIWLCMNNATGGVGMDICAELFIYDTAWMYAPQFDQNAAAGSIKVFRRYVGDYQPLNTAKLPAGVHPNAVAFAPDGKLWVLDVNHRLLRYSRQALETQATPTPEVTTTVSSTAGDFIDLAFWGNDAFISHGGNMVLRVPLSSLNGGGTVAPAKTWADASFGTPAGLAFDAQGKLWISQYSAWRITRLNVNANAVDRIIGDIQWHGYDTLAGPEGLAFNSGGTLIVGNNGKPTYTTYSADKLNGAGNDPSLVMPLATDAGVEPGHSGFIGGVALDGDMDVWFNYENRNQIRERTLGGISGGQTLENATTDPGFGGIAFWPVPSTLNRGL